MFPWALLQHLTPGPVMGVIVCDDKAWLPQDTHTIKSRGNKNWHGFQFVLTGLKPHASCGFGLILDLQNPFQTLPPGGLQAPRSDVKTIALQRLLPQSPAPIIQEDQILCVYAYIHIPSQWFLFSDKTLC